MSRGRLVVRTFGELCITLGALLLLLCAYQLFWTNVQAHAQAGQVSDAIRETWQRPPSESPSPGASGLPAYDPGTGFAFLRIPRLGRDWASPVVEGVTLPDLHRGVGHYPGTAMPGEIGNFAVAGHRATNGEPFRSLDELRTGDAVVVETRDQWYVYRVTSTEIVPPTQVGVILPVPDQPGKTPKQAVITLTTCNPRWASYERLIVFGLLESTTAKQAGVLPPALTAAAKGG